MRWRSRGAAASAAVLLVGALAGCSLLGGNGTDGSGGGGKTVTIASDLPLQGASADSNTSTNNAIKLYLQQIGYQAGGYRIVFTTYDNSTSARGSWDDATCEKNARSHVATPEEIAVLGTYNSGCAQIEVPILNQDPAGPMLMVSNANTNPGLTKAWERGEPQKYYPSGKRNYARVITTDEFQGSAAAQFAAQKLGARRVYILNDNQTYGQGVARAFAEEAKRQSIEVLGNEPWDGKQTSYAALFTKIKSLNPDLVYFGGIYDNNGGQLVKDKVAILGDNTTVKLMAPDGFTGYPDLQKLPEGQGMYLTFAGLSNEQLRASGGAAAALLRDYRTAYGKDPAGSYALYGVAAMQVILAALEKSDGTRKSVTDAVFSGDGITIPAEKSVLGKEIRIDPATGDTSARDISVLVLKGGQETFVQAQPVG